MNLIEFKTFTTQFQSNHGWDRWSDRDYETVYEFNSLDRINPRYLQKFFDHVITSNQWRWEKGTGGAKFTEAFKLFRSSGGDEKYKKPATGCSRSGCADGLLSTVKFYDGDTLVKVMPYSPNFHKPPGRFAEMRAVTGVARCDCVGDDRYTSMRGIRSYGHIWGE